MTKDWKRKILKQKSLYEIYKLSSRIIPRPNFNVWLLCSFRVLAVIFVIWSIRFGSEFYSIADTTSLVHSVANYGYSFSLSVLGFLITGFAIFATLTKPEIFIILAQIPYKKDDKDTGISRLQFIFFNFLRGCPRCALSIGCPVDPDEGSWNYQISTLSGEIK